MIGQAPSDPSAPAAAGVVDAFQHLGWVDVTALSVLGVFFVLGLFKGFVWQVSRVAILVVAYGAATHFGQSLSEVLLGWTHPEPATADQQETAFYVACVLIFLGVLIALSLLALLLQSLIKKAGLTFFDRLGGGLVGVATGALVVLSLLCALYMFFPRSHAALAAQASHSRVVSQKAVDLLGKIVPDEVRRVFELPPLHPPAGGAGDREPGPAPLPGGDAPKDPLKNDPPKSDLPKKDPLKSELPKGDSPKSESPKKDR